MSYINFFAIFFSRTYVGICLLLISYQYCETYSLTQTGTQLRKPNKRTYVTKKQIKPRKMRSLLVHQYCDFNKLSVISIIDSYLHKNFISTIKVMYFLINTVINRGRRLPFVIYVIL